MKNTKKKDKKLKKEGPVLKRHRLPVPLALLLLVTLAVVVVGVKQRWLLKISARTGRSPQSVRMTNVTDKSFVVSWLTLKPTTGSVSLLLSGQKVLFNDQRDRTSIGKYTSHYVVVNHGLLAGQEYKFSILSGGKLFQKNSFKVKLANLVTGTLPKADLAYGEVKLANNNPAAGAVVYFVVSGLAPLSSLVSSTGHWVIPLSVAFDSQLTKIAPTISAGMKETLRVTREADKETIIQNCAGNDQPAPVIILGRNADVCQNPSLKPQPTKSNSQSFLPETGVSPTPAPFVVLNPAEGEKISTRRPQFFGRGPRGGKVKIEIHSPQILQADIAIGDDQRWSWTVPDNLTPGQHTLTAYYYDSQGKKRTITRHFTVLAADNSKLPAFTASDSGVIATPLPTPLPSPTSSPPPLPTATPPPSFSPIPSYASGTAIPSSGFGSSSLALLLLAAAAIGFAGYLWWINDEI